MTTESRLANILSFNSSQLPAPLMELAKTCLLDLIGVAASATQTQLANIGGRFVKSQYPGHRPLLFTQGSASPIGAALYGGWLIDALDAHDGHVLTKGHAGVALLPGLLAMEQSDRLSGKAFLAELIVGYEIATRAGIALHATSCDYHTSGTWNCLGVAGVGARLSGFETDKLHHALGIAEFYAPRSQMMRCIDHPTMLKDGSGWGAMTGIASVFLAQEGFTGAPSLLLAQNETNDLWDDLGDRWRITEQYFKRYPVCYWAQPAIEAVLSLRCDIAPQELITDIEIETFHQARRLHVVLPDSTEQAQYSLPWAVACAVLTGTVNQQSVTTDLGHQDIRSLAQKVRITESPIFNRAFPARRWSRARIRLSSGRVLESQDCQAAGTPDAPLSRHVLNTKFLELALPVLGERAYAIQEVITDLDQRPASDLLRLLGPIATLHASDHQNAPAYGNQ
ncbi:MAG: MmgE/PrpD family protein [Marinobacter sp.]